MANRLKMARVQSILLLHEQGWSRRRIARELSIDCEPVSRYVRLDQQSANLCSLNRAEFQNRPIRRFPAPARRHFQNRPMRRFPATGHRRLSIRPLRRSSRSDPQAGTTSAAATANRGAT
jgi:hypothetical protein